MLLLKLQLYKAIFHCVDDKGVNNSLTLHALRDWYSLVIATTSINTGVGAWRLGIAQKGHWA